MPTPAKAGNRKAPTGQCSNCCVSTLHFLHHVCHRGIQRLLCTSCVLRFHPTSFCPSCFTFYDAVLPHPSKRISCSKCASFTHTHCAATSPLSPYICPPCKNSSFSFFHQSDRIDKRQAIVLLCASRIAMSSMTKSTASARKEAERKVREAAVARMRAREALEHLVWVSNEENVRRQNKRSMEINKNNGNLEVVSKVEEMEDNNGDFDSLLRHLENSLIKEEV
ncbi:hypothetical protein SLE2022_064840 [Rubroshorea leprosula]